MSDYILDLAVYKAIFRMEDYGNLARQFATDLHTKYSPILEKLLKITTMQEKYLKQFEEILLELKTAKKLAEKIGEQIAIIAKQEKELDFKDNDLILGAFHLTKIEAENGLDFYKKQISEISKLCNEFLAIHNVKTSDKLTNTN